MEANYQFTPAQEGTYHGVFQHPVARDLSWPEVRSMLGAMAEVVVGHDGAIQVTRNGQSLVLPRPRKNVAQVQEVMEIRRFLDRSAPAPGV